MVVVAVGVAVILKVVAAILMAEDTVAIGEAVVGVAAIGTATTGTAVGVVFIGEDLPTITITTTLTTHQDTVTAISILASMMVAGNRIVETI